MDQLARHRPVRSTPRGHGGRAALAFAWLCATATLAHGDPSSAARVRVRVLDDEGKPLVGVPVAIERADGTPAVPPGGGEVTTTLDTDKDGRVSFRKPMDD